ncbi:MULTISPECIES: hypothetical protein [unclassified Egicoccus]|uniref:hypothetical protein n=1 Tax=unclassified Egicoccus TaxID=2635606 RepID=UPI00359D5219
MAHATVAQLTAWLAHSAIAAPADNEAGRLLERASVTVDRATVAAIYAVNDQNDPTDDKVRQAFVDATCAQVEWWLVTGDEYGQTAGLHHVTQGSANISGRFPRLAPRARDILVTAGLGAAVAVGP